LDESFADAICCDAFFAPYAEPSGFFAEDDVALFDKLDPRGETTFYDSVCGVPLFTAPRNRTFAEWRAESEVSALLASGWQPRGDGGGGGCSGCRVVVDSVAVVVAAAVHTYMRAFASRARSATTCSRTTGGRRSATRR
jgi:hypothetical protein